MVFILDPVTSFLLKLQVEGTASACEFFFSYFIKWKIALKLLVGGKQKSWSQLKLLDSGLFRILHVFLLIISALFGSHLSLGVEGTEWVLALIYWRLPKWPERPYWKPWAKRATEWQLLLRHSPPPPPPCFWWLCAPNLVVTYCVDSSVECSKCFWKRKVNQWVLIEYRVKRIRNMEAKELRKEN